MITTYLIIQLITLQGNYIDQRIPITAGYLSLSLCLEKRDRLREVWEKADIIHLDCHHAGIEQ